MSADFCDCHVCIAENHQEINKDGVRSKDMIINPIIPIKIMVVLCCILLLIKRRGAFPYLRQMIMIALLFCINLRIMIPDGTQTVQRQQLNAYVLFVVDDTISMVAEDYNGNGKRLDAVKEDCCYIIDELEGARFAVISFHNDSAVMMPFTGDAMFAKTVIQSITPLQRLNAKGTSLNVCKDDMLEMLENARSYEDGSVILFFISDGEITGNGRLESFSEAEELVDQGAVLGYGTSEGGQMYVQNYAGAYEQVEDVDEYTWESGPAVSCIDERNLKSIAGDIGIEYIHMSKQSKIDALLAQIKDMAAGGVEEVVEEGRRETYYWFALPLAVLLAFEFIGLKRKK